MGLAFKATCDGGSEHSGPFHLVTVRIRQLHSGKTSPFDRTRVLGVFCEECIKSGAIRVSLASFENDDSAPASLRESCGSGAGGVRE